MCLSAQQGVNGQTQTQKNNATKEGPNADREGLPARC